MTSAIFEAILGLVLLVLFLAKFLNFGPLNKLNVIWESIGSRAKFVKKWWFNLIFFGFSLALISAPLTESKASKLGIDRGEYSKLEADGRLYGLTAEQYFEEGKKAKDIGYQDAASYIDSKKMGIGNPKDYLNAKKLGVKDNNEYLASMNDMKSRKIDSIDAYIQVLSKEIEDRKKKEEGELVAQGQWILRCKSWASAKDACAVAPNARKCIDIKMGEGEAGLAAIYCQGDEPQWGLMGKR